MAAGKETVYIKADRNVEVTDPCVKLGDIRVHGMCKSDSSAEA